MSALLDERSRQESELRPRRMRRRPMSPSGHFALDLTPFSRDDMIGIKSTSAFSEERQQAEVDGYLLQRAIVDSDSQEMRQSVARASLRSKFDHVCIDPHSSIDRDARAVAIHRGLTNSPPPPGLTLPGGLPSHSVSGFVRQHIQEKPDNHFLTVRSPSPLVFVSSDVTATHSIGNTQSSQSVNLLHIHHAVGLSSVSLGQRQPASVDALDGNPEVPDIEVSIGKEMLAAGVHSGLNDVI